MNPVVQFVIKDEKDYEVAAIFNLAYQLGMKELINKYDKDMSKQIHDEIQVIKKSVEEE